MAKTQDNGEHITISAPKFKTAEFRIRGTVPYCQNKFSGPQKAGMIDKQREGSVAKTKRVRAAKDFDALYEGAKYTSPNGWNGIPAAAFRNASISACRIVGFKMTLAKLSIFCEADGFDAEDGTPLVRIVKGKPVPRMHPVRNASGVVDIRNRPFWDPGWEAVVRIRFDSEQFKVEDIANLLMRVGQQVGVGEGRPDSKESAGQGWGLFEVLSK